MSTPTNPINDRVGCTILIAFLAAILLGGELGLRQLTRSNTMSWFRHRPRAQCAG
jgi:hypothetical protein